MKKVMTVASLVSIILGSGPAAFGDTAAKSAEFPVSPELRGKKKLLSVKAKGYQVYRCGADHKYALLQPEAVLYFQGKAIGIHKAVVKPGDPESKRTPIWVFGVPSSALLKDWKYEDLATVGGPALLATGKSELTADQRSEWHQSGAPVDDREKPFGHGNVAWLKIDLRSFGYNSNSDSDSPQLKAIKKNLAEGTHLERVFTQGGAPTSKTCATVGDQVRFEYSTTYSFYDSTRSSKATLAPSKESTSGAKVVPPSKADSG